MSVYLFEEIQPPGGSRLPVYEIQISKAPRTAQWAEMAIPVLVDTGSEACSLTRDALRSAGVDPDGLTVVETRTSLGAPGVIFESQVVRLDFAVTDSGGNRVVFLEVPVHLSDGGPCVLGLSLLRFFHLYLKAGKVHLTTNQGELAKLAAL